MKNIVIVVGAIILLAVIWMFIPSDTMNYIARKQVEFSDGDYNVTYSQDTIVKIYKVRGGKITSTTKGYYFFWEKTSNGKKYRQLPIDKTIIEEI